MRPNASLDPNKLVPVVRPWFMWFPLINYFWYYDRRDDDRTQYSRVNRGNHTNICLGESPLDFGHVPLVWTRRSAISPFNRVNIGSITRLINQNRSRIVANFNFALAE